MAEIFVQLVPHGELGATKGFHQRHCNWDLEQNVEKYKSNQDVWLNSQDLKMCVVWSCEWLYWCNYFTWPYAIRPQKEGLFINFVWPTSWNACWEPWFLQTFHSSGYWFKKDAPWQKLLTAWAKDNHWHEEDLQLSTSVTPLTPEKYRCFFDAFGIAAFTPLILSNIFLQCFYLYPEPWNPTNFHCIACAF